MAIPLHTLIFFSDSLIAITCFGILIFALNESRVRANPAKRIVGLMIFGIAVEAANLVVDTGLWVPRPRSPIAFLAILHFAGVLRGLVVGVLLTLVVLRLLRPNPLNLGDSKM
jgi:hypothetical protein